MKGGLLFVVAFSLIFGLIGIQESFAEEKISVQVDGGKLLNFEQIDELGSMNFEIFTDIAGTASVNIELPKSVWHIVDSECNPISPLVLVDGQENTFTDYFEKNTRIITIDVVGGSEVIELIVSGVQAPHTTSLMYGQFCFMKEQNIFLSPKKQLDLGFMFYDVQCKDNLVKITKKSDGSRVCVKLKTAEKLVERSWANPYITSMISPAIITTDKIEYKIGEPVTITVKNVGTVLLTFPDSDYGIFVSEGVCCGDAFYVVTSLSPGEHYTLVWDQYNWLEEGTPIEIGEYEAGVGYWDEDFNSYIAKTSFVIVE